MRIELPAVPRGSVGPAVGPGPNHSRPPHTGHSAAAAEPSPATQARIVLEHGKDPEVRRLAEQVIAAQQSQITRMRDWLTKNAE